MDTKESPDFIREADEKNGLNIVNGVDGIILENYCERIEHLQEEIKALQNDIKEIFNEAKARSFNVKALKEVLKRRSMDESDRIILENDLDIYQEALGMR